MLRIDPEFESQIPPLVEDEFRQLEENIVNDGVIINPLIVWNGIIVDGHNRYRILQLHPEITYTTHEKDFPDRYAANAWICKNQLGRRNLTEEQKKYLLGRQYKAEKAAHGGDRKSGNLKSSGQNDHLIFNENTRQRLAKENNVSESYVRRAEYFADGVDAADEAVPGICKEILSGKLKVKDKDIVIIAKAAPAERLALVEQLRSPKVQTAQPCMMNKRKELEEIRKISAQMEHADLNYNAEDILCELEDALRSFIIRWNTCMEIHGERRSTCCDEINKLANIGIDYLTKFKEEVSV